jgi:L-rhamnose mutarotase
LDRRNGTLFAYAEIESEQSWQQIAETEICRRWWSHMKDLMLTNADHSPVTVAVDEVFHLD